MAELTAKEVELIAQAVAQGLQGVAQQIAQQTAQQIGQLIAEMQLKQAQVTGQSTVTTSSRTENADIGGSERLEKDQMSDSGLVFSNQKRTYDEYQHESLESIKRNRTYVDKVLSDALQYDNARQNIANQALQNSVETANMVAKQCVRHADVAIDGQWNPVQQGAADTMTIKAVQLDDASVKAIAAAIAIAMQQNKVA